MAKIQAFEKYADKYEDWFEKNHWAYQSELLAIKEHLPKKGKGLEIGVGSGLFAGPLGIKFGVEPSPRMRKLAKKRGIEVVDAYAEKLPFNDAEFDFALMVTTICFVDDLERAFREAYRILKPNGRIIIGFVDKSSFLGKLYQQHKNKSVFYEKATFYSKDEVIVYLKNTGFKKFNFSQTIFKDLKEIKSLEPTKNG
ncbi:MAG: SAM-dependent methyltransferase, partial [Candidatus Omnitrophota bacterium]